MKKHVIIATSAALLSTSAFATKSRMTALGQDDDRGSQYLNDTRNKFRNAAHVNNMNNYVVTEWGADGEAEGGMFRDSGNFAYGLYFNDQSSNQQSGANELRDDNNSVTGKYLDQSNGLDLFFGGDAGVQWGARVHYSSSELESADATNDALGLGFGVLMGDLSAYANLGLSDESEGTVDLDSDGDATSNTPADKFEADLSLNLGVAYDWNNWTFHADYDKTGNENTVGGTKTENTDTTITVGAAQVHEISSTSMVFTALDYENMKMERGTNETKSNDLKATVGFEADATSWLTWRGSVSQIIVMGDDEDANGNTDTNRNSTAVNAGASLTFGKLMVDGRIGTDTTATPQTNDAILNLDDVMGQVAVSYWF